MELLCDRHAHRFPNEGLVGGGLDAIKCACTMTIWLFNPPPATDVDRHAAFSQAQGLGDLCEGARRPRVWSPPLDPGAFPRVRRGAARRCGLPQPREILLLVQLHARRR